MKILITGGAGFIGSACARALMERGDTPILLDNFNDYYDPQLKRDRIEQFLGEYEGRFILREGDIRDTVFTERIFSEDQPEKIIHLAAMAGVRNSLKDPLLYADVNVLGTTNLLNLAVRHHIKNFVYASSSSIYGKNTPPFSETDSADTPISPYAATKKATELMAHTFSHIYQLPTTGLRFFTVYGPWGRPDMALFHFTKSIFAGEEIEVYNFGKMSRNFTYVNDIVSGTLTVLDANLICDVMNIGGDQEETLLDFIKMIETCTGKTARKKLMPIQPGDVMSTVANIDKLRSLGWQPTTRIDVGIKNFVDWYRKYYQV
ncbi:MAG: NAD-dependent epimerase/dehydratase family protein [Candidatus Moranbacteria bacterium]|jgi:UDP-glucuronate 4-epimerase|nr:NAD-dependent epimerase/dehydratase family protein [Candidatus Moranbacteria bacterium]MBP9801196.1 NAD-dependent epimerase/dehydratase family protein [Candidatus Moranbacteria bacterium]